MLSFSILLLIFSVAAASVEHDKPHRFDRTRQRRRRRQQQQQQVNPQYSRERNKGRQLSSTSFNFRVSNAKLPKALSDLTATLYNGTVFLAGGCDSENGNVYNTEVGEFICGSISDQLYAYNYQTDGILTLASMPRARYRHAAVAVNGKLWLLGGRKPDDDTIIGQVDVYDMATDSWNTFDLPQEYHTSDHTGFPRGGLAFFVGGYNETYAMLDTVFAIDSDASFASRDNDAATTLVIVPKAPLLIARGDASSITDDDDADDAYAMVTGGFGERFDFCEPEPSVELYDFKNDSWSLVANLTKPRSDMGLVEINGLVFAFGGERLIEGICDLAPGDEPEPAEETVAVDDVEVFDWKTKSVTTLSDLPSHRFRFAAVGIDDISTIITFGGQLEYNESCLCFKASSDIMLGTQVEVTHDAKSSTAIRERLRGGAWRSHRLL